MANALPKLTDRLPRGDLWVSPHCSLALWPLRVGLKKKEALSSSQLYVNTDPFIGFIINYKKKSHSENVLGCFKPYVFVEENCDFKKMI